MADKDKKFKDYDSSLLRFVGNCIAAKDWSYEELMTPKPKDYIDRVLDLAFYTRKRIRKLEDDNG